MMDQLKNLFSGKPMADYSKNAIQGIFSKRKPYKTLSESSFFPGKSRKFDVHKKKMFLFIRWLAKQI